MRTIGLALFFLLFAASETLAQTAPPAAPSTPAATQAAPKTTETPEINSINVRSAGIFTASDQTSQKSTVEGIPFTPVTNVHLSEKTRTIPLRKGVDFGFQYQAVGKPVGERATLHFVVLYPSPGLRKPGSSSPIQRDEYDQKVRIGVKDSFDGYALDNDWELVPGDWTLEIWSGSNKLASETFTLVKQ